MPLSSELAGRRLDRRRLDRANRASNPLDLVPPMLRPRMVIAVLPLTQWSLGANLRRSGQAFQRGADVPGVVLATARLGAYWTQSWSSRTFRTGWCWK
jgi:hypothetical protein